MLKEIIYKYIIIIKSRIYSYDFSCKKDKVDLPNTHETKTSITILINWFYQDF